MDMDKNLMGFGKLGLTDTFSNIVELEAKILSLDQFKEVQVKTESSEGWEHRYKGIWNESKGALAGIVTKDYLLVQHKDAFLPLISVLRNSDLTKVEGRIDQTLTKTYIIVNFKDPRTTIDIKLPDGSTDKVNLSLYLKHGVDGSLALWGTVGGFRIVCSNGMVVGNVLGVVRKVHRGSVTDFFVQDFYEELLKVMVESSEKISDMVERSFAEMIKGHLIEAVLYGAGFGRNYVLKILEKCKTVDKIYKWDLYNKITEYMTHEVQRATFQKRVKYLQMANNILTEPLDKLIKEGQELIPIPKNR